MCHPLNAVMNRIFVIRNPSFCLDGLARVRVAFASRKSWSRHGAIRGESEEAREKERKVDEKDLFEREPWRDPNAIPPVPIDESVIGPDADTATELTNATLEPQLNGGTPTEQLRDALSRVASSEGSPEAKAEMLAHFASQIHVRSLETSREWVYRSGKLEDGSFVLIGPRQVDPNIPNLVVLSPQGNLYKGHSTTGFIIGPRTLRPDYNALKPIR